MGSKQRRAQILEILKKTNHALTGSQLSETCEVTRQVIVADIALLRAMGEEIMATPQGYLYAKKPAVTRVRHTIAAKHSSDPEQIREELYTIIDNGGIARDVTVEHPVYGEMIGNLQISSRFDVENFLQKLTASKAEPLLVLTDGLHLHTIETPSETVYHRIHTELSQKGFLVKENNDI